MAPAVILSDRASGTTTFLGLLYAALVRWGSQSPEGFRVHASHASIRALKDIYASLMDGHFPPDGVELRREDLSFVLGYASSGHGWLSSSGRASELQLHVASLDTMGELRGRSFVWDQGLREKLASQVAVVLVDAGRLPVETDSLSDKAYHPWRKFDALVASSLALLETYQRTDRLHRRARLHPIFVLTKFDTLPSELRHGTLGGLVPSPLATAARATWGEDLLAGRLPQTWAVLQEGGHGVQFERPLWFTSWVGTERGPHGELRVRRHQTASVGGWEPDYPYVEFESLLSHLHKLASRVGDPLLAT
ncbi:MAG: hypothetical protein KGJ23_12850 [Euryarchaeota archaeon]|nr:hypothetical protein [Euryarchaeota archaeon]MDE1837488.1 hypothetical protein [Euryarchaeota archaeon]MDE2045546.1 hypothetical protein [Thermoplasmata archaeon]